MAVRFATAFLFLLLALHKSNNSLFSRFRNPNEFVAAPGSELSLEELEPDMYEQLLQELPELRGRARARAGKWGGAPRLPFLKHDFEQSDEYDFMMSGAEDDNYTEPPPAPPAARSAEAASLPAPPAARSAEAASLPAPPAPPAPPRNASNVANSSREARRWFDQYTGPKVATCYVCNLSYQRDIIPDSPLCHDAFESQDWQAITMARYFRAHCRKNHNFWGHRIKPAWTHHLHEHDRGLYREYFGAYIGGCFKRFLDVGEVYTARGCRSMPVKVSGSFANHRFMKLELLLKGKKNVCIVSPHASLTPFSRAISLYVRYHVCVCEAKFCNRAPPALPALVALLAPLQLAILLL